LAGLSFAVLIHSIPLLLLMKCDSFHKEIKIEDLFSNAFRDYPELKETYDDVLIIHNNNLSTFPAPLFDENFMGVICNIRF
jgi:hypothetical protein